MESTYCRLFEALQSIKIGLNLETIIVDFEKAAMNASQNIFQIRKFEVVFLILPSLFGDMFRKLDFNNSILKTQNLLFK
jgi:hypothetical protein